MVLASLLASVFKLQLLGLFLARLRKSKLHTGVSSLMVTLVGGPAAARASPGSQGEPTEPFCGV